jgi:5,5'-dehydrodivanillate O-demethylase
MIESMGRIYDRTREHLGRVDESVVLKRMVWQRELRALAEGRPIKEWTESQELLISIGALA